MKQDIAQIVLKIRKSQEWSQERLAQELGVSFSTVNGWERGRRNPQPFLKRDIIQLNERLNILEEDQEEDQRGSE